MHTFRNKAELRHWLKCYQKAIDVNIITSITDEEGRIIYANKKFCSVSGYSKKELIGTSHSIVNSSYHSGIFFGKLWKTIKAGRIWRGEIKNKTKEGKYYWVDTVIIPVQLTGKVEYLSLRVVITEKKELERIREEYVNSLGELLFITSHKVRQPLVSIQGLIQLGEDKVSGDELKQIIVYLKASISDLDKFTREMTHYLHKLKDQVQK
ncbi:MAG: PAS domain-containing protein [Bacteroidia bacterium]